jgi:ribosomal protein L37E
MKKSKKMMTKNNSFEDEHGKICLVRCPKCKRENYAHNVMSGVCTWCGFDANEKKEEQSDEQRN